ncbi:MAG: hypothetical protein HYZ28_05065 [Myxococcales bacterium]|nr:hypothetical protein [Myxococcales bacterium]
MRAHSPPGFLGHLWLLWRLRLSIGLNRGKARSRALAIAAFTASSAPALLLGLAFYRLLTFGPVARSPVWPEFLLNLLCFVTTCVWCAWPVLSAGVDDHSELSRYAAFPISGFRLMVSSTLASLFEPRAIVFYGPITGAALGYMRIHPPTSKVLAGVLFAAFVLFNAALSRVGLHAVLNVLRQKRSAELIGGFFVVLIIGCSFIPPIDTSWLLSAAGGVAALSERILQDAALALSRVPPGYFGDGLRALGAGESGFAVGAALILLQLSALALGVAYWLLLRFQRKAGSSPASSPAREKDPFAWTGSLFRTLLAREALDLWHNPRARLLASVPFLLTILLKLLSGRDLFVFFLGATADAWLMGGLCLYGAVVIASTFSQNAFAYDGQGLALMLAAPVDLSWVLKAKNAVHALAALALSSAVGGFYLVYFRRGGPLELACALAAVAGVLPVLLSAGNFLSLYFPVKFHADLRRRDRLPFAAAMLGVAAAGLGSAPFAWALRMRTADGPSWSTVGLLVLWAAASWVGYLALLPLALRSLRARAEKVLQAITRE